VPRATVPSLAHTHSGETKREHNDLPATRALVVLYYIVIGLTLRSVKQPYKPTQIPRVYSVAYRARPAKLVAYRLVIHHHRISLHSTTSPLIAPIWACGQPVYSPLLSSFPG